MKTDVRRKSHLDHDDIVGLNFIRADPPFRFRKHPNQGLRSHILELLHPEDLAAERRGIMRDGLRHYPRARPQGILRIFKNRFASLAEALEDTRRIKVAEIYLPAANLARSSEFIVAYTVGGGREIVLCGLQPYVEGRVLDPWTAHPPRPATGSRAFFSGIHRMVAETGLIPDLAGIGNLRVSPAGTVILVDINNILPVDFSPRIHLDDKDYPACDKSVEALMRLERMLLGGTPATDRLYRHYLTPDRRRRVASLERRFYEGLRHPQPPPRNT